MKEYECSIICHEDYDSMKDYEFNTFKHSDEEYDSMKDYEFSIFNHND